ncbi:cytosolic phospholipase A2 gamma-like isoform X2 [Macrotis lagotis]|uniref:cytosolic phospholipase A2 gamma-like isoform X2 n=1 Tax=Macrotis lagotis TaxID=92651 RepID=UPI003D69DFE2
MTDKPKHAAFSTMSQPGKQDERSNISVHFGISEEEKVAVQNRGKKVLMALQKLGINTKKSPIVSVLVSGGGLRATIACQGVLTELSHLGILDMVTYLAGVSGSTWCMASLYTQSDDGWEDLQKAEVELQRRLREGSWKTFVALDGLCKAAERDDYSLTDFWSYSFVYFFTKELINTRLSQVRLQSEMGTVPYPIFAAIEENLKIGEKEKTQHAWFEFTPDWAGYSTLGYSEPGTYVSTTYCGSKFEGGKLIQQEPERDLSYLRALCSSVLADKDAMLQGIMDFFKKLTHHSRTQASFLITEPDGVTLKDIIEELFNLIITFLTDGDCLPHLESLQFTMSGDENFVEAAAFVAEIIEQLSKTNKDEQNQLFQVLLLKTWIKDLVEKSRVSSYLKFLWKTNQCLLTWTWGTMKNFMYKYGDIEAKHLTHVKNLHLMDAGLAINSAYPLVLPPVRNSDIILSFDFSEDPFMTITETEKYCKSCNIPFPPVDKDRLKQDADAPWDCYVFEGEKGPVVMHFPLFNRVNCGSAEVIEKKWQTYETFRFRDYSDDEVIQLLEDSKLNVRENKDRILAKISELSKATS